MEVVSERGNTQDHSVASAGEPVCSEPVCDLCGAGGVDCGNFPDPSFVISIMVGMKAESKAALTDSTAAAEGKSLRNGASPVGRVAFSQTRSQLSLLESPPTPGGDSENEEASKRVFFLDQNLQTPVQSGPISSSRRSSGMNMKLIPRFFLTDSCLYFL